MVGGSVWNAIKRAGLQQRGYACGSPFLVKSTMEGFYKGNKHNKETNRTDFNRS
jgi:hypothetical protein